MSDYISEKIEQYERKLKQAEKAGKHNNYPGRVRTLQELFQSSEAAAQARNR